jgi:DNA-binding transcriptional ArsR family regulator
MQAVFKALADPTRREILRLLRSGPKSSGQLAEHFDSAWPTVSRHLALLRDAGLIISTRDGQSILYELNTTVFDDLVNHLMDWTRPSGRGGKKNA